MITPVNSAHSKHGFAATVTRNFVGSCRLCRRFLRNCRLGDLVLHHPFLKFTPIVNTFRAHARAHALARCNLSTITSTKHRKEDRHTLVTSENGGYYMNYGTGKIPFNTDGKIGWLSGKTESGGLG